MQENDFSEKIALYFYFSYLDEARAQSATIQVLKKIRQDNISSEEGKVASESSNFVRITNAHGKKRFRLNKSTSFALSTGYIVLPKNSNWGPWFEFRKLAGDKEFHAVLYSKVLNISDEEIAKGLDVSLGTVRYRIGRGLKILGKLCLPETAHAEH